MKNPAHPDSLLTKFDIMIPVSSFPAHQPGLFNFLNHPRTGGRL